MTDKRLTQEQVNEKASVQKLAMTESDYQAINPEGHKRVYRADGNYSWSNTWTPNDGHGRLTKKSQEINECMTPFADADSARVGAMQEKIDRAPMRDSEGRVHFVEPGRADDCASLNGWGHRWRAGGLILRAGPDGMDFRLVRGEWEATGFRLTRGEKVPIEPIGMQRDPDGNWWAYQDGEWRRDG